MGIGAHVRIRTGDLFLTNDRLRFRARFRTILILFEGIPFARSLRWNVSMRRSVFLRTKAEY